MPRVEELLDRAEVLVGQQPLFARDHPELIGAREPGANLGDRRGAVGPAEDREALLAQGSRGQREIEA